MFGMPSTVCQIRSSFDSSSFLGGTTSAPSEADLSGTGSSRRLIFPLGLSGIASICTKALGTMYSGKRCRATSFSRAAGIVPVDFPEGTT